MPALDMDHFTVLTQDLDGSSRFYAEILGLREGGRPPFGVPGLWLYAGERVVLHLVAVDAPPRTVGVLDHMAFKAAGLMATIGLLKEREIPFRLGQVPGTGLAASGQWVLNFSDPNGAKIELDFGAAEPGPED